MGKEVKGLLFASTSCPGKECDLGPERSFQPRTLPAVYPETRGSHSADGKHGESTTALAVTRVGESAAQEGCHRAVYSVRPLPYSLYCVQKPEGKGFCHGVLAEPRRAPKMAVTSLPLLQPKPQEYFRSLGDTSVSLSSECLPTTALLLPLLDYFPLGQMPSNIRCKSNRTNSYFYPPTTTSLRTRNTGKAVYPTLRNIQKKTKNVSKYDRLSACPKPDQELETAAVPDLASSSKNRLQQGLAFVYSECSDRTEE